MNLRELKYVLLGEDRLSPALDRVTRSGTEASRRLQEHSSKLARWRQDMAGVASEIPGLGAGLRLLSNPLTLIAAGGVAASAGIRKATDAARQFNHEFRDLANLNLGKSKRELSELKQLVLDTSFANGFDQSKTNTGIYDIQSVTGLYGAEAARIVSKQGLFANLMKADFNEWIAGTGKAMANYGFGAEDLDRYNASAYATMKAGYITFDKLAQVSAVYAGAAASAKQDFNTANKMLTLFTLRTKSADEASTRTKSLFNDLTKAPTIEAFRKAGIDVFDANGKFKQADVLLLELNKRFRELGDEKSMIKLKNQFTGSEGLIALIQAATDKTGALQNTLIGFENSKLGINEALQQAREDTDYINEQLQARTKVLLTEIGQNWLPIKNKLLEAVNYGLEGVRWMFTGKEGFEQQGRSYIADQYLGIEQKVATMNDTQYAELMGKIAATLLMHQQKSQDLAWSESLAPHTKLGAALNVNSAWRDFYYHKGAAAHLREIMTNVPQWRSPQAAGAPEPDGTSGTTPSDTSRITAGIGDISGGGPQVRQVNVTIGKLIESFTVSSATVREAMPDLGRMVEEELVRAIGGAEQTLAIG